MTSLCVGCGMCCDGTRCRTVDVGEVAYVDTTDLESLDGLYRLMMAKFDTMPGPAAARREHSELLLSVVALRVILAREFEPWDSKSHQPEKAQEGEAR